MKELAFVRFCLGIDKECPSLSEKDWQDVYNFCEKQSLLGIGFQGMEKLSTAMDVPLDLTYQWIGDAHLIMETNKLLNERCVELQRMFAEAGFTTRILKGQGNATLYNIGSQGKEGQSLALLRQAGDIDIWVLPNDVKRIIKFLESKCDIRNCVIGYHHVDFPFWKDTEVEVHWRPSWRLSPIYNYRLQKWCMSHADHTKFAEMPNGAGGIKVPTWEFNVVYLLQHMFLHIFQEGLGMRQLIDYYFLLRTDNNNHNVKNGELCTTLKYLGLYKFAGAMMYVLREMLSLDAQFMIAPVDEGRGKFMFDDIIQSGNFGQYDERNKDLFQKHGFKRNMAKVRRQMRFLRDYPHETLCAPFQIYHLIYRKLKLWRWE